jgi:serine/threonine-protein kinase
MTAVTEPTPPPTDVVDRYHLKPSRFVSAAVSLFEGVDPKTQEPVLVRVLRDDAFASTAERQRARRELQKLTTVRHDALASVVEVGEANELTWYARELVEGETLAEVISREGAIEAGEAAWMASKTAAALAELHKHGVQHRDLRPERIVLREDGSVKVLDAAVGRVTRLSDGRVVPGVPGYVAPEAVSGRLVSFRSDLYALGAVLYEALAGKPTFPVADVARRVQLQTEGDPEALPTTLPDGLVRFVTTLLAREQRDRPFSAQQVERQLEPFAVPPDSDDLGIGERTIALDTPATDPAKGPSGASSNAPPPMTAAARNDEADNALTGLHEDLEIPLPGASTIMGMSAPTVAEMNAQTQGAPSTVDSAVATTPSGAVTNATGANPATGVTRLPKMPTLPPIPGVAARASQPSGVPGVGPPGRKATIVGMPMNELRSSAPTAAPPSPSLAPAPRPIAGAGLEYDDLGDTTVNDDSRMFGSPGAQPAPQGSAVPPFPDVSPQRMPTTPPMRPGAVATMQGMGGPYDPMSSTVMAAAPVGFMGPQTVSSTVSMQMPGGVAVPPPPAQAPFGAQPQAGYAGYAQQGYASVPAPVSAPKRSMAPALAAAALLVVGVASAGGYAIARYNSQHENSPTTVVPTVATPTPLTPTPVAAPPPPVAAPPPLVAAPPPPVAAPPPPVAAPPPPVAVPPPPVAAPAPPQPVARANPPEPGPERRPRNETAQPGSRTTAQNTQPGSRTTAQNTQPGSRTTAQNTQAQPAQTGSRITTQTQPAQTGSRTAPQPTQTASTAAAAGDARIQEAIRARNYPQARTLLQAALRSQPNSAPLHAQLGNVLDRLGDRPGALAEYRTAVRLDRRNPSYLHRMADLQIATNDRNGAIATLRQILTVAPNDRAARARLTQLGAT